MKIGYAKTIKAETGSLLSEMGKVTEFDLFDDQEKGVLRNQLRKIEKEVDTKEVDTQAIKADGDVLESLPKHKRATYKEVVDLIYDCSVNQVAARSLIDRILDRLSRT